MKIGPHTPFEVLSVLKLHPDYDLVVRCLEYIRLNFGVIVPERAGLPVYLIALCHHHPNNVYPALATTATQSDYPDLSFDEIQGFTTRIDAWVEAQTRIKITAKKLELIAVDGVLAVLLYVFSYGPVVCITRHRILAKDTADLIYRPLRPLLRWTPFYNYMSWWYFTKEERENWRLQFY